MRDIQLQYGAQRPKSLSGLPTEIVQMIAQYVSPVDAASLAFCSRTLVYLLGRRQWDFSDSTVRSQFLARLERDYPALFYCESCSILHPRDAIGPPGPAFQPEISLRRHTDKNEPPSLSLWRSVDVHPMHSLYDFNFMHLQLAMKRYHHGPEHGIPTESLAYTEVRWFEERSVTTLLSVEARACCDQTKPSPMCLRIQNWALVGGGASRSAEDFLSKIGFIWICTHLSVRDANISQFVRSELDVYAYYYAEDGGRPPSGNDDNIFFKCRMCAIDYRLQVRRCGDEGPALVITKWLDLGAGSTPMGIEWKRHLGTSPIPEIGLCLESAGDVVRLFDGDDDSGMSLNSLTHRNQSYLVGRRFTEEMDWWDQKTWILQGEQRLPSDYPRPPAPVPDRASLLKESTDAIKDLTAQIALLSRTVEEKTRAIRHLALSRGVDTS